MIKYCPKCGTQLSENTVFCGNCGMNIAKEVQPEDTVVAPTSSCATTSQRKFNPILIVAGILIVAVIAFMLYSNSTANKEKEYLNNMTQISNNMVTIHEHLQKIETLQEPADSDATKAIVQDIQQDIIHLTNDMDLLRTLEEPQKFTGNNEKIMVVLNNEKLILDDTVAILQAPLDTKQVNQRTETIKKQINELRSTGGLLQIENTDFSAASDLSDLPKYLDAYVKQCIEKDLAAKKREMILTSGGMYKNFLNKDPNYVLLEGHMGAAFYLDKSSVKMEKNEGDTVVIAATFATVHDAEHGNTTITSTKEQKFMYTPSSHSLFVQRDGIWRHINPNGSMAEIRCVKSVAEAAYYVATSKVFFGGYGKMYSYLDMK